MIRLFRLFAETHQEDLSQLRECLEAGDPAGARRIAHTLKGVSATLGATRVRVQAQELETALKEGRLREELEPRIDGLDGSLRPLLAAIREALGPDGDR